MRWATRQATIEDVPALRDLCVASVGSDDYVLDFLERFVRESVTFVAVDGVRLVGMMVYDDTPDGGVWLHAARTHPEFRGKGVAGALNRTCERLARSRDRTALRLWASATNAASVAATLRSGFRERARFSRLRLPVSGAPAPVRLEPVVLERDWPLIAGSRILRKARGYLFHDFYFLPLNRRNATWLVREGALLRFGGNIVSLSEDYEGLRGADLQVQLVAGDPRAMLAAAPSIARARGRDRVESFLPHDSALLERAREAGFDFMDWGREAVLFEKRLRVRDAASGTTRRESGGRAARRRVSRR